VIIGLVGQLIRDLGLLRHDDPGWNCQAKVVAAVWEKLTKLYPARMEDGGPGDTTLKKYVRLGLEKYKRAEVV
jgi:hypothetical protein